MKDVSGPKARLLIPAVALFVIVSGCRKEEPHPPPKEPSLTELANQLSGKPNTPPTNTAPAKSTEELLALAAGTNEAADTKMRVRTFIDGIRDKAEEGDKDSMYWLGYHYYTGKDVEQNAKLGARWLQEAAERNHEEGQYWTGLAYEEGKGVPKDLLMAYQWFYLAAQKGHLDAIERRDKLAGSMPEVDVEKARLMAEQFVPK